MTGYGNIPEEGMAITLTEAEEDILTGEMVMGITGSLICNGTLSVSITRSETGLTDEFCCADKCTGGNKEQEETLQFTPGGKAKWYIHYMPASGSETEITYLFKFFRKYHLFKLRAAVKHRSKFLYIIGELYLFELIAVPKRT